MKRSKSPSSSPAKFFEFSEKIGFLEKALYKSKQVEVNLTKKILRLEAFLFDKRKKPANFKEKAPGKLKIDSDFRGKSYCLTPGYRDFKEEDNSRSYLTPNHKKIIELFHQKKSHFEFDLKKANINETSQKTEFSHKNEENSTGNSCDKEEEKARNSTGNSSYKEEKIPQNSNESSKLERLKKELFEKIKAGAIEVILEKEQRIHELENDFSALEEEIQRILCENSKQKEKFSQIFEEMQYENEDLLKRLLEEKAVYKAKLQEKEQKIEENFKGFLEFQLEKYKKNEIMLNSELDEQKSRISRLERENFSLQMKILEREEELNGYQRELQRKNEDLEREFIRNQEKSNDFLMKSSKEKTDFQEIFREMQEKLKIFQIKIEEITKEKSELFKEKSEIYDEFEDLLEEKRELERVHKDLKEFSKNSFEGYEKIIEELKKKSLEENPSFHEDLHESPDEKKLEKSQEKTLIKRNPSLYEDLQEISIEEKMRNSKDEDLHEISHEKKLEKSNGVIDDLKEEVSLLENVAIEAKIQAAQALTDRDYFEFKYRQSLEFIKGMTGGNESNGEKKESFKFFKEVVRRFSKIGK